MAITGSSAASEPTVPGARRDFPHPNQVASSQAVVRLSQETTSRPMPVALLIRWPIFRTVLCGPEKFLDLGLAERCWNAVFFARPFAQVDQPAALAAKGEILVAHVAGLLADGARSAFSFAHHTPV